MDISDLGLKSGGFTAELDNWAKIYVGQHYLIASLVIIVLILILLWMWTSEGFNPTATMRAQMVPLSGSEALETDRKGRGSSYFAQVVQDPDSGKMVVVPPGDQAAWAAQNLDCGVGELAPTDAWAWMNKTIHEPYQAKPKDDSDYSKILTGH